MNNYSKVLQNIKRGKVYVRKAWLNIDGPKPRLSWYVPSDVQRERIKRVLNIDVQPCVILRNHLGLPLYWLNKRHDILENDWIEMYG